MRWVIFKCLSLQTRGESIDTQERKNGTATLRHARHFKATYQIWKKTSVWAVSIA